MIKTKIAKTKITSNKNLLNINNQIDQLINDPTLFIISNNVKTLINIIKYAAEKYYNGESIISDEIYDILFDYIKEIDPTNKIFKKVGAKILTKNKAKLPYYIGSMDKIKPTDQNILNKWLDKYTNQYIYSDKLDGVSGLLVYNDLKLKLYTRGNGNEGTDISNLIQWIPTISNIKLDKLSNNYAIRGELIISKKNFLKYIDIMANGRNMVSGIVNSKTINTDIVSDIDFIAYELINPWIQNQIQQFNVLKDIGFKIVEYNTLSQINFDNLSNILIQRKTLSKYEIDGLIISIDNLPIKRTLNSNPEYAFAFKDPNLNQVAIVKVLNVEWSISKDGYIKTTLKLVPTHLGGVIISSVTAINAKYVVDNILGTGSIIELIRSGDVIPKIKKIIKSSDTNKPQLPDIKYKWSESGVDIITLSNTLEQQIKELTFFFKKLSIANIDESTVRKMIEVNIDSIPKIINIEKNDLIKIDGFKKRMVEKIYINIHNKIKNLTMLELMIASNIFGHCMGNHRLNKIMESYPDIIELYTNNSTKEIIQLIKQLDGYDTKTAEYFGNNLEKFIELFNSLKPDIRKQLRISCIVFMDNFDKINEKLVDITNKFAGKIIVFSGFRNKEWEKMIELNGGKVGSSISSKTNILVTTQEDIQKVSNAKVIKAIKLKIIILVKEEFENQYIN